PVLALGSIGWVPGGLGIVEGEEIPYQPWAAARKKENLEHWLDRDPEIKCFQPGVPRGMYMPYPFQIIQSATQGQLVVDVKDFTDATWFDRSGDFHSDALHVIERYKPDGPNVIRYEATIEDPQV